MTPLQRELQRELQQMPVRTIFRVILRGEHAALYTRLPNDEVARITSWVNPYTGCITQHMLPDMETPIIDIWDDYTSEEVKIVQLTGPVADQARMLVLHGQEAKALNLVGVPPRSIEGDDHG